MLTRTRLIRRIAVGTVLIALLASVSLYLAGRGWLGRELRAGTPSTSRRPAEVVATQSAQQAEAAVAAGVHPQTQILFGDLHVHSGFSVDAYALSLPMTGGSGTHTVSDACDFARFCSSLDFWSINDHAEASTPRRWRETIDAVRHCNAVGAGRDGEGDLVSYLGWEWSHMGTTAENHFGHRNVILRDLTDDSIPTRPIASDSPADYFQAPSALMLGLLPVIAGDAVYLNYAAYQQELLDTRRCPDAIAVRDLPEDCREYADTPGVLLEKLDDWGFASLVVPHGMTWGMYTPQGSSWAKQLDPRLHDPVRQRLVEVYSGHGNVEQYRPWRSVEIDENGTRSCPAPSHDYVPACWRAGEIIRTRCLDSGAPASLCEQRAATSRQRFADAPGGLGHLSVPGYDASEWLDSGQCRDCFLPAFNYRPASSVQSMVALSREDSSGEPLRFRFGFIGSSDIHTARPGTGYKEQQRTKMADVRMSRVELPGPSRPDPALPESRIADPHSVPPNHWIERGRAGSFFFTGGLVAVHARRRDRGAIWEALETRQTYATSGPRILLWFNLLNSSGPGTGTRPMGSVVGMHSAPRFEVRAVGSLVQQPGCADFVEGALPAERLERLCGGECYNPSDVRRRITRIEVVRIRPQQFSDEPLEGLIEDPWRVFECEANPDGCVIEFADENFESDARDALYYVRAIEEPSPAVNGGTLRCKSGEDGACQETDPCQAWAPDTDDCLAAIEERAWSSPIFVDWAGR
jgi:hypothetical protein